LNASVTSPSVAAVTFRSAGGAGGPVRDLKRSAGISTGSVDPGGIQRRTWAAPKSPSLCT
jgi:hypothetical protein